MLSSPLVQFAITLAAILLLTFLGPQEKSLGANVRLVYLHGAWVLTALAAGTHRHRRSSTQATCFCRAISSPSTCSPGWRRFGLCAPSCDACHAPPPEQPSLRL